jgi:NADPH:quinone reductase-like Zn-dependent oxidoreductase
MKVLTVEGSFGLSNLTLGVRPDPEPGAGQICIDMRAASLNYRDLLMVTGRYNPKQPLPLIPGSDGVGVVSAVGDGVTRFAVGDRVMPIFAPRWHSGEPTYERMRSTLGGPLDGVLAEKMVVDADSAVATPEYLSDVAAATLPCAALTAWTALCEHARLRAGDCVLIQGSGGVSLFALQLAKLFGARTIALSKSDEKLARMIELGAEVGINYEQTPQWGRRVRELAGGEGVDVVIEVGGAKTLAESLKAIRPGGFISMIGVLSGTEAPVSLLPILMKAVHIQGALVGTRDAFEAMNRAIAVHRLEPVVDETFSFDRTRAALEHLQSGAHFGKICIEIG